MNYIDLTRTFDDAVPVYPGDPQPVIKTCAKVEVDGFTLCEVTSGMHVGTHMDAPLHFIANGKKMHELPIEKFFGRGVLLDGRGKTILDKSLLEGVTLKKRDVVLILTGWSNRFDEGAYFTDYPEISLSLAEKFVEAEVSIVGTDSASPDHEPFETHKKLLGNEILILENLMDLEQLVGVEQFTVIALPAKYATEAAPARVIATVL